MGHSHVFCRECVTECNNQQQLHMVRLSENATPMRQAKSSYANQIESFSKCFQVRLNHNWLTCVLTLMINIFNDWYKRSGSVIFLSFHRSNRYQKIDIQSVNKSNVSTTTLCQRCCFKKFAKGCKDARRCWTVQHSGFCVVRYITCDSNQFDMGLLTSTEYLGNRVTDFR